MFSRRIYLLLIACICASILSPVLFTTRAFALTDPITVTSETSTTTFPQGVDFQVSVQDPGSLITQATLTLSSRAPHYFQADRSIPIPNPAQMLTLQWHEDTSGDHFVYPGTAVSYVWQFHDRAGHVHIQPAQTVTVIDTRFNWQHLSQDMLQVYWYNQSTDFGQIILSQAADNVRRISMNLGGNLQHPITLWVYQNSDDFHGSLPPQVHEWVGGIAFPSLDEASIVVDSPNAETLTRDMPHELTHLVFHQLTQQGILAPLWFDEGMAVYNQTYHEPEMTQRLKRALATQTLLRLNTISYTFPADAQQAYLAYAQSWNLISYMYTTFGQAKMARLITLMSTKNGEFNADVQQALGEDQIHLENQWRLQLHQPAVLAPDQVQSTQQPSHSSTPPKVSITTDSNAPLLILVGMLLIVIPTLGISGLLFYQGRRRQKRRLVQQAQQIINSTYPQQQPPQPYGPNPYSPYAPYGPYGQSAPSPNPKGYPSSGVPPYNAGYPAPAQRAPLPPGQPLPPANAPGWGPVYPTSATPEQGNQPIDKSSSPTPFKPGQEYLSRRPQQQAPQE